MHLAIVIASFERASLYNSPTTMHPKKKKKEHSINGGDRSITSSKLLGVKGEHVMLIICGVYDMVYGVWCVA